MDSTRLSMLHLLLLSSLLIACECLRIEKMNGFDNNSIMVKGRILLAPSGPNPGGNSKIDGSIKAAKQMSEVPSGGNSMMKFKNEKLDDVPPSGPNPGGNGFTLGNAKVAVITQEKSSSDQIQMTVPLSSKLPKGTPTPGSGPSPVHNSVSKVLKVPPVEKISCTGGDSEHGVNQFTSASSIFTHN